ncbi:MAG: Fic family protein, partial [Hungatella hathewayi]|nr:Fic family protein [Hungatella hathewayi]
MKDPYLYPHTELLKNLANIQDENMLSCMEAEYTSLRLAELVMKESASCFDFMALCEVHFYIFQDIYEWAGKKRVVNIEKAEPALGGISIEYSDWQEIEKDADEILDAMNQYPWDTVSLEMCAESFTGFLAALWKVHPYREGNTRTVVTFCSQFIESKGFYIDSDLFKDNAQYMRTALVAASAVFHD